LAITPTRRAKWLSFASNRSGLEEAAGGRDLDVVFRHHKPPTVFAMLPATIRFKLLFGPYRTPRFKFGAIVEDEIRGKVRIFGVSDAPIPWPLAIYRPQRSVVVYGALARAIRQESVQAVAYWWGISVEKVRLVRRALGVPAFNEGSSWLWKRYSQTPAFRRMSRKAWANAGTPERRAKVAASRLGKKHPDNVRRKIAAANRQRVVTLETRRKLSAITKRLWAEGLFNLRRWTAAEIALLNELTDREVASRTGRTVKAVREKRRMLDVKEQRR
jgi:hypothetical protein